MWGVYLLALVLHSDYSRVGASQVVQWVGGNLGLKKQTRVYNEELHTLQRMRCSYYNPPVLLSNVPFTREPVGNALFHSISHKTSCIVSNINLFKFHLNVIKTVLLHSGADPGFCEGDQNQEWI